jgi:hypothetical protein
MIYKRRRKKKSSEDFKGQMIGGDGDLGILNTIDDAGGCKVEHTDSTADGSTQGISIEQVNGEEVKPLLGSVKSWEMPGLSGIICAN